MDILKEVVSGQFAHLVITLILGLAIGVIEKRNPARNINSYSEHFIEIYALLLIFFVALVLGLLHRNIQLVLDLTRIQTAISSTPWYLLVPLTSLIADFGNYFAHRILHTNFFWKFHRWHHSPEHLFWFSGFRGSAVHVIFLAITSMIILTITGPNPWVIGTIVIQGLTAQMLGHMNIDIKNSFLEKILVLPQFHRIHHAVDRKLNDSNFGFCWTFWDKLFKTFTPINSVPENYPLGLMESDKKSLRKLIIGND